MGVTLELVLKEIVGGLWHTTHPDHFTKILESGGISPEPDIPDNERFGTAAGENDYSYVRSIGGVSLFDLHDFDPDSYSDKFPASSWAYFIPCHLAWGCAVWIEIDREKTASRLISPAELKIKSDSENAHRRRRMPGIEAAYRGILPRTAFRRAFIVHKNDIQLQPLEI
jgi:hypothetical protein